jgi:hypothetical protein
MGYASFGPNEDLVIAMDNVDCTGNETTLQACPSVFPSDCYHPEDASVVCGGSITSSTSVDVPTDVDNFDADAPPPCGTITIGTVTIPDPSCSATGRRLLLEEMGLEQENSKGLRGGAL